MILSGGIIMSLVITIGRQYGSAGIEIGKKIADVFILELALQKMNPHKTPKRQPNMLHI